MRWTRVAIALLLAAGLTGCGRPGEPVPWEVTEVGDAGPGRVQIRVTGGEAEEIWQVSDEGHNLGRAERARPMTASVSSCAGQLCYRVVTGLLRVETGGDAAGWTTAWQITGADYTQLAADYMPLGAPATHLSSTSVVVHEVAGGGHVVFVANGRDGLLHRSADGRWHRLGLPKGGEGWYFAEPPRLASEPPPADPSWVVAALVTALLLVAGAIPLAVRRAWHPRAVRLTAGTAVGGGLLSYAACHVPGAGMFPPEFYAVILVTAIVVTGLVVILNGIAHHTSAPR